MHLAIGILTAYIGATRPARARRWPCRCRTRVLNLCRVKMRDQLRLDRVGYLEEYPQYPHEMEAFADGGAARRQRRRRRPAGLDPEVQGLGDRPQRLHLLHDPGPRLGRRSATRSASPSGRTIPRTTRRAAASRTSWRSSPPSRTGIEDKTKYEAVDILRKFDIPCAPVLSMKELLHDQSLRASGIDRRGAAQGARQLPGRSAARSSSPT